MKLCPETGLPLGEPKPALPLPHFPTRHQAVIWRNWGLVSADRLAQVLGTTPANIALSASELGLGEAATQAREHLWLQRGYITLIRQNWHLLPYPQLLLLVERTPEQFAYALKEDDFLWNKLGGFKPATEPVRWRPLTPTQAQCTAAIRERTRDVFIAPTPRPPEAPFAFLDSFGRCKPICKREPDAAPFSLKLLYSYSAVYGDPLLDPSLDPFPDGLLSDLAANGINAVWLQGVLYTLVPWFGDTPYSEGHEIRIANLNRLIERARRFGIGVYLYLNEPRAMPAAFYETVRPEWRGAYWETKNHYAMCTSNPSLLDSLRDGVSDLFRKAPDLTGVFTITFSENLTHCKSRGSGWDIPGCHRCHDRGPDDLIAEVNNTIADGVHRVKPDAPVIAWNWSWDPNWAINVVMKLRSDVRVMCNSESWLQSEAMGIRGRVADYTMSKVGPGFLADELWSHARSRGLERVSKIQLNNTWECSAVPYLPVPYLVKAHLRNMEARGIRELMVGWTLGGYPGGNLPLTEMEPEELAETLFGSAASGVTAAWKIFCAAFAHFPLHGCSMLYAGPQNYGPMNPLYAKPTGYRATMVGFPYDCLERWRGLLFPQDVFEEAFRVLSEGWLDGVKRLRETEPGVTDACREAFDDLMRVAEAAGCHFRTTYLQILFIRLRDESRTPEILERLNGILDEEIELARTLLRIMRCDSRIGFEASNHYYYTENALVEKILNCDQVRKELSE